VIVASSAIIFEFADEIESFVSRWGAAEIGNENHYILALQPEVQAYLKRRNINYFSTLDFFSKDSHQRLLLKSNEIIQSLRNLLSIKDNLGIEEGYNNTFIFYLRSYLHYLLWLAEIISNAISRLKIGNLYSFHQEIQPNIIPSISKEERYVGIICKMLSKHSGITYKPFFKKGKYAAPYTRRTKNWMTQIKILLVYYLSYVLFLLRSRDKRTILAPSTEYNLVEVIDQFKTAFGNILPVYLYSNHKFSDIKKVIMFNEYCNLISLPGFLRRKRQDDFLANLNSVVSQLEKYIDTNTQLFTYRGIYLGKLLHQKIKKALIPLLCKLYAQSWYLDKLLRRHKPTLILSQHARGINYNLGELARHYRIPSVLISHGSHIPPSNKYEEIEWGEHGLGFMNVHYEYLAIQSPWAMAYLKKMPTKSRAIVTGPLLFAKTKKNKDKKKSLRQELIPQFTNKIIVLHASTPKARNGVRFYVYETIDEYIENINSLIKAVESIDNIHLIIRFRPSEYLIKKDLIDLLVESECYSIHSGGSFADYLSISDILVSYSSTTIEESLQNQVPVIQFAPDGRYCHIKGELLDPQCNPEPKVDACYYVNKEKNLSWALNWVIQNHIKKGNVNQYIWRGHIFNEADKVKLPTFFAKLF